MQSIYDQLAETVLPLLTAYETDFTLHDRESLAARPGVPFLHWTHATGTTMAFLPDATDPEFPKCGELVPYLFGTADREHILQGKRTIAEYHASPSNGIGNRYTVHHYDGRKLKRITVQEAVDVVKSYARPIEAAWRMEWLRNNRPAEYRAKLDARPA